MRRTARALPPFHNPIAAMALLAWLSGCGRNVHPAQDDAGVPDGSATPSQTRACTPHPVTRASDLAPDLYAWISAAERGSCHLVRRESGGVVDGFPDAVETFARPGQVSCDATGCWRALPAFARAWSHVPAPAFFAPPVAYQGEQWTGTVRAARHQDSGEVRATLLAMQFGSSAVRRLERRFDAAGHLLEDRHYFGSALWFTTTNTWQGGQLVASRYVDAINRTGTTDYSWSYASGRLLRATIEHRDSGRRGTAEFTYDASGRLTSVARSVDGQRWVRQAWTWDATGRLQQSSTELVPKLYDDTYQVRGGDDLEPLLWASSQLQWLASGAQLAQPAQPGACAPLPHTLGYGYPAADGVYALGWPVGDRPNGIDADYGFGPAYDSALDRWFGHDRVEGISWAGPWPETSLRVVVVYDDRGRMVRETLSTDDGSGDALRTRVFEGERMTQDTRLLHRDGAQLETALTFRHDDAGRLLTRGYTMNGVRVAEHSWGYTASELTRHGIAQHRVFPAGLDLPRVVPEGLAALPAELPVPVVHERRFAEDGRTVTILRDGVVLETRTRDAAGRIVARRTPPENEERYSYDASGELRSYASSWKPDHSPELSLSYDRSPEGRLLARHWSYNASHADTDRFTYACP